MKLTVTSSPVVVSPLDIFQVGKKVISSEIYQRSDQFSVLFGFLPLNQLLSIPKNRSGSIPNQSLFNDVVRYRYSRTVILVR